MHAYSWQLAGLSEDQLDTRPSIAYLFSVNTGTAIVFILPKGAFPPQLKDIFTLM